MPEWRVRPVASFPPRFIAAMEAGEGRDKLLWEGITAIGARDAQNQFRIFRYSLRNSGGTTTAAVFERALLHRTRVCRAPDGILWQVRLTSKKSALLELENAQDLGIEVDRLPGLR